MAKRITDRLLEARAVRGNQLAQMEGQVRRVSDSEYQVRSQRTGDWYQVYATERGLQCSCPDFQFRGGLTVSEGNRARILFKCKHIFAVELSHALRQTVERQVKIEPVGIQTCLYCYSKNVVKHGLRHNINGDIQRFTCRDCGKRFTKNLGFESMKASPEAITGALQLYFSGESLRNTMRFLQLQGVSVRSPQTVLNWITKYVGLMGRYLDQIRPDLSGTWRADELYIKVKGNLRYLFAMMDDQTRWLIAQEVADTKDRHDARGLFHMSAEIAGKRPRVLITDGLHSYSQAWKKEFRTLDSDRTIHVRDISFKGHIHNNKMERLNGEIRDREKTFRGLKREDSPILKGCQLYHNFIRPHEALDGQTPADRVGIKVEGDNKWLTIIQNASKEARV